MRYASYLASGSRPFSTSTVDGGAGWPADTHTPSRVSPHLSTAVLTTLNRTDHWGKTRLEPLPREHRSCSPSRVAVWTFTYLSVLRHGLIGRRHLCRRVDEPVKVQSIQYFVVGVERPSPGPKDVGFGLRIALEYGLHQWWPVFPGGLIHTSDNRSRQRRPNHLPVLVGGVVLRRTILGDQILGRCK